MSTAVPKLVQRFRSRELAKAATGWEKSPNPMVSIQNPFLPFFNPETKRWAPPLYSRRRQAELIKAARATNSLHLLPPGPKLGVKEMEKHKAAVVNMAQTKQQVSTTGRLLKSSSRPTPVPAHANVNVEWMGAFKERAVPGADFGARLYAGKKRMFKGHKWERQLKKRRGQIRVRMRDMGKRIKRFKTIYKRRTPYALKPPVPGKKETLPF